MLTTPGGNPASLMKSQTLSADKGVSSEGFRTTTFPVARAGAIFHDNIPYSKKINSRISATTRMSMSYKREIPWNDLTLLKVSRTLNMTECLNAPQRHKVHVWCTQIYFPASAQRCHHYVQGKVHPYLPRLFFLVLCLPSQRNI